jgi:E3 ubiquitin-protein ligase NEDD4
MPKIQRFRRENDIEGVIDETFTTAEDRFGELVTIELKPGGADVPVTEENKKEYVE